MGENTLYKIIGIILALSIVITIITANIVSITAITLLRSGPGVVAEGTQTDTTKNVPAGDTQPDETVSPDDTTPGDTTPGNTTPGGTSQTTGSGSGGTTAATTTATKKTNAEIATLYNNAMNKTKAYNGNVKIKSVEGVTTTVTEMTAVLKGLAQSALAPLNSYPKTREATFSNGAATARSETNKDGETKTKDPGEKLAAYLPPPDSKNASLKAAGIKDAKYTAVGGGYKLEITLVKESGEGVNFLPPHHSSVMDTLGITDEDLGDFRVMDATTTYGGATITANVNAQGLLTSLNIYEIVNISGKIGHKSTGTIGFNTVLDGDWKQDITFTY